MVYDLALNLLSEIVGIAITVFLVDRLIRKREEQRWRSSKDFVKAKVFAVADDFLAAVLGYGFSFTEEKYEQYTYYFGRASVVSHGNLEGLDPSTLSTRVEYRLRLKQTTQEDFDYAVLSETQQKLTALLDVSGSLMDAELANLLFEFEDMLGRSLRLAKAPPIEGAPTIVLTEAVSRAVDLCRYLQAQATNIESLTQFLNNLRKTIRSS